MHAPAILTWDATLPASRGVILDVSRFTPSFFFFLRELEAGAAPRFARLRARGDPTPPVVHRSARETPLRIEVHLSARNAFDPPAVRTFTRPR